MNCYIYFLATRYFFYNLLLYATVQTSRFEVVYFQTGEQMNIVHRHPSLLHQMLVTETKLITASPERPGTIAVLSYW